MRLSKARLFLSDNTIKILRSIISYISCTISYMGDRKIIGTQILACCPKIFGSNTPLMIKNPSSTDPAFTVTHFFGPQGKLSSDKNELLYLMSHQWWRNKRIDSEWWKISLGKNFNFLLEFSDYFVHGVLIYHETRPGKWLPTMRAGEQGPYLKSLEHLGWSSEIKE